jgi:very-short-patch-repair endonuclease
MVRANTIEQINKKLADLKLCFVCVKPDTHVGFHELTQYKCTKCNNIISVTFNSLSRRKSNSCCPTCHSMKRSNRGDNFFIDKSNIIAQERIAAIEKQRNGTCLNKHEKHNSSTFTRWECGVCKHIWEATLTNIVCKNSWCPKCVCSASEQYCIASLTEFYPKLNWQYNKFYDFLFNSDTSSTMQLDFYCEEIKLAIEYQGKQHAAFDPYIHGTAERFESQQMRDRLKAKLCAEHGITLLHIPHTYSHQNIVRLREHIFSITEKIVRERAPNTVINTSSLTAAFVDLTAIKRNKTELHERNMQIELAKRDMTLYVPQRIISAAQPVMVRCKYNHVTLKTLDTFRHERSSGNVTTCDLCSRPGNMDRRALTLMLNLTNMALVVDEIRQPTQNIKNRRKIHLRCLWCDETFSLYAYWVYRGIASGHLRCMHGCPAYPPTEYEDECNMQEILDYYRETKKFTIVRSTNELQTTAVNADTDAEADANASTDVDVDVNANTDANAEADAKADANADAEIDDNQVYLPTTAATKVRKTNHAYMDADVDVDDADVE